MRKKWRREILERVAADILDDIPGPTQFLWSPDVYLAVECHKIAVFFLLELL